MLLTIPVIGGAGYFAAAAVAAYLYHREVEFKRNTRLSQLYLGMALILSLLGLVHIMNLTGEIADGVRTMAKNDGWYATRRPMQARIILFVTACVLLSGSGIVWKFRKSVLPVLDTVLWLGGCIIYTTIAAISLHQIDWVLSRWVGPIRIGNLVQLGLLTGVMMSLIMKLKQNIRIAGPRLARH